MAERDIEIVQGSTFAWLVFVNDVDGNPLDMSGYTGVTAGARGQIRKKYADVLPTESFTIDILNKTGVVAAIGAGKLRLPATYIAALLPDTDGSCYLLIQLTATETAAIAKGTYCYDIEIEDTVGYVFKPYFGACVVVPEVTKPVPT